MRYGWDTILAAMQLVVTAVLIVACWCRLHFNYMLSTLVVALLSAFVWIAIGTCEEVMRGSFALSGLANADMLVLFLWAYTVSLVLGGPIRFVIDTRASQQPKSRVCKECGYDLRGTTLSRCSECGSPDQSESDIVEAEVVRIDRGLRKPETLLIYASAVGLTVVCDAMLLACAMFGGSDELLKADVLYLWGGFVASISVAVLCRTNVPRSRFGRLALGSVVVISGGAAALWWTHYA